jgi:hypothetical protein
MKVDRVLIALNNNPVYTKYWNYIAPVWKKNFNINPTLIFFGNDDDIEKNLIDTSFDIIKIKDNPYGRWSIPCSLFWLATLFPKDICMTCGIDEIPLNYEFFNEISLIDENKFIIGLSDAYNGYQNDTLSYYNTLTNVLYPSGYLVAKGEKFKEIFGIEDDFLSEVSKIENTKSNFHLPNDLWGIDECYFSDLIYKFEKKDDIVYLDFYKKFGPKRIYDIANLNIDLLKSGYYSEFTSKNVDIEIIKMIIKLRYNE